MQRKDWYLIAAISMLSFSGGYIISFIGGCVLALLALFFMFFEE